LATPVTMPQLGETVVEGTITKWLKQEGETVERDEPLFEISTDKVDTEVPSPLAGKLSKILVPEGETVRVGTELAMIEAGDGQAADGQAAQTPTAEPSAPPAAPADNEPPTASQAPAGAEAEVRAEGQEAPRREAPAPSQQQPQPPVSPQPQPTAAPSAPTSAPPRPAGPTAPAPEGNGGGGASSRVLSPLVRRLAEENQIDLARIQGTGTGGRVTKRDVMAYLEAGPAASAPAPAAAPAPGTTRPVAPTAMPAVAQPAPAGAAEEAVSLTRMRQAIAAHMVTSIQTSARAWNMVEVDMENVVRTREAAKESFRQREGVNLTFMPFVARAVVDALQTFPFVNAELRDDQIVLKRYVNLGIAVALEEGLIVPVVKGAETMNIVGLARAINDIATRARVRKLNPDEVHGSTFTITNPGPFGSILSVPIINQPNCAILAFDAVEKRPVVRDDAIAIRHMVYLSMSWDHRIIDGATAAQFLGRLKQNLETWDFGPEVGLPARGA
jgi:pyruvate dehydrogenase E2 component (dihydrolipoyllysine-residue acetyltransferase)